MTDYPRKPNERAATSGDPIAGARLARRGGRRAALKFTSAIVVTAAIAVLSDHCAEPRRKLPARANRGGNRW